MALPEPTGPPFMLNVQLMYICYKDHFISFISEVRFFIKCAILPYFIKLAFMIFKFLDLIYFNHNIS